MHIKTKIGYLEMKKNLLTFKSSVFTKLQLKTIHFSLPLKSKIYKNDVVISIYNLLRYPNSYYFC